MSRNLRQNRRLEPTVSQLDSKGWKSLLVVIGQIILTCAIACGIPYGLYLYYQHLSETGYFLPENISIHGNLREDDASILEASGLQAEDANLFEVDVHTVEAGIETLPWIKKAKVRVDLPRTVDIEIEEHDPMGLVNDGQLYVVDHSGIAIKLWTQDDTIMAPVVTIDKPLESRAKAVVEAFSLSETIRRAGYPHRIDEIHYDAATGYTMYTGTTEIRFGYTDFEDRLERLMIVEDVLDQKKIEADYILLDSDTTPDRIVVRPKQRVIVAPPAAPEPTDSAAEKPADAGAAKSPADKSGGNDKSAKSSKDKKH
ncbi:MAG: FtsQ-type POTRA domain-containing protein [Proteobacteria bacterium]|nr:FtsQ-type POTRA domain-containing protein [Pseudomonadota bacterium]